MITMWPVIYIEVILTRTSRAQRSGDPARGVGAKWKSRKVQINFETTKARNLC